MKQHLARVCAVMTLAVLGGCGSSTMSQAQLNSAKPLPGRTVGLSAGDSLGMTFARDRQIIALRAREGNEPAFANVDGHEIQVNPGD